MASSEPKPSLLDLHDYALTHICTFLSFKDQFNLGRTCSRLKNIINYFIARTQVDFRNIYETKTYEMARDFFTDHGLHVKDIYMDFDAVEHVEKFSYLIPENCPNIEKIRLDFMYYVDTEIMEAIFNSSKNIKSLVCNARMELTDDECQHISKLSELEILNIHGNPHVTGLHLASLTNLKELILERCDFFNPEYFIDICKANKLRKLNIECCHLLNDKAFEALVETQTELEEIIISQNYVDGNVSMVSYLKNLQRIRISSLTQGDETDWQILKALAQNAYGSLRTLEIDCPCELSSTDRAYILKFENLTEIAFVSDEDIDDEFLLQLSKNCSKLKKIGLSQCSKITNKGVLSLVTNLKRLKDLDLKNCSKFGMRGVELYQKLVEIKKQQIDFEKLCIYAWGTQLRHINFNNVEGYREKKKIVELLFEF